MTWRSMASLVLAECHLWLNLTDIREKNRTFLLNAPLSQEGLFGDAVTTAIGSFSATYSL